ncbi:heat shock protein 9 [Neocallimastix lanati (nom. inval.)]|nr:heat shock protein 9 [Neocallimastix sp. JGI-2020a]
MILEAEKHAESDKKKKDVIEIVNNAQTVIADTEKAMNDFKEQLDATESEKIKGLLEELKGLCAQDIDSLTVEQVKGKIDEVQQASLKLFELVYKNKNNENNNDNKQ